MTWPAWRVCEWAQHFQSFPPAGEAADILMALLNRVENIGGLKPGQLTRRSQVSRFYREPTRKKSREQKRRQIMALVGNTPIRPKTEDA